jgi:K+-sensing histidine kinase KdpD
MNDEDLRKLVHDLRTPLTVVDGFARMLERGEGRLSADDRAEFVFRIREAAEQMSEILDAATKRDP